MFTKTTKNLRQRVVFSITSITSFILVAIAPTIVKAQYATDIYTDFNGFWKSSVNNINTTNPNKDHNVLAFTYGGVTYSTGTNNSILTGKGISFVSGNYTTLPFPFIGGSIPASGSDIFIALPEQADGVAAGYSNPLPASKVKDVLTDGIHGLNIGTGVTNLPSAANMVFPANITNLAAIGDNQPDIIFAQLTNAATSADVLSFQDNSGKTVGKSNSVQWNQVPTIGTQQLDLYNLTPGALIDSAKITSGNTSNIGQSMRLLTIHLADFGITTANAHLVKSFVIKPAGSSDPAFIAYNTEALNIVPPVINIQPQSQVVCTGSNQSATFSVTVTGQNISYQWTKDGIDIPGATNSSYFIPVVTEADVAGYRVIVRNMGGVEYSNVAYLNTSISRQPAPAAQSIVTGNKVTYSVSANNATSFQWKKDGVNIPGATDSIFTINEVIAATKGTYTVHVINSASGGCASILSNPVVLTPVTTVYSNAAGDLENPATFGVTPDGTGSNPVDFTRAEHTFVIANRSDAATKTNWTIAGTLDLSNANTTITANTTIDVGRLIRTGNGVITGTNASSLILRGNSDIYMHPKYKSLKSLTITGGNVNVNTALAIEGTTTGGRLNLQGGTLAVNDTITLKSTDVDNTSIVTSVAADANIVYGIKGIFVTERFIPGKRAYRFISPTVTTTGSIKANWMENANNPNTYTNDNPFPGFGTHITGRSGPSAGFDASATNNPSLFTYNTSNQQWQEVVSTSNTLKAGDAYRIMVRGSRSVDINNNSATPSNTVLREFGRLTTGQVTINPESFNQTTNSYTLVGNPYASSIDWKSLQKTGLRPNFYVWDPNLAVRGAYVSYNSVTGTTSSPHSTVNEHIQPGQAFFVQTSGANPSLIFEEANKTTTTTHVFRPSESRPKLTVELLLKTNGAVESTADALVEVFDENFSNSIGEEESFKITNLDENIAINRDDTSLSIEGRPIVTDVDTIPLKIWQYRQKEYYLKINASNFDSQLTAILHDNYLGFDTALNTAGITLIPFSITTDKGSSVPDRFTIYLKQTYPFAENITEFTGEQKQDAIQLKWKTLNEGNTKLYEIEKAFEGKFRQIGTTEAKPNNGIVTNYSFFDNNPVEGTNTYRLKIIEKEGVIKYSRLTTVNYQNPSSAITVYPNPVTGKIIGLKSENIPFGSYNVQLVNASGQIVYVGKVVTGKTGNGQIQLKEALPAGTYFLQLMSENLKFETTMIVQ